MFALLRAQHEGRKIANAGAIDQLFTKLASSPSPLLRRIYLSLTEKLILMHKSKVNAHAHFLIFTCTRKAQKHK